MRNIYVFTSRFDTRRQWLEDDRNVVHDFMMGDRYDVVRRHLLRYGFNITRQDLMGIRSEVDNLLSAVRDDRQIVFDHLRYILDEVSAMVTLEHLRSDDPDSTEIDNRISPHRQRIIAQHQRIFNNT